MSKIERPACRGSWRLLLGLLLVAASGCGRVDLPRAGSASAGAPETASRPAVASPSRGVFQPDTPAASQLHYLVYLPREYDADPSRKYPLCLFLHGSGERGTDLSLVRKHGPPKMLDEGSDLGVILLVPQCPPDGWWENEIPGLVGLLEQVAAEYRVDPERVYLTGLSMGGYGSWAVAGAIADRIAALVPVCGGGTLWQARSVARAGVPVWMFHGDADTVVPLEESTRMIRLLERWGGKGARLTVFPSTGHDSWTAAYRDPELWRWMLSQRRGARPRE